MWPTNNTILRLRDKEVDAIRVVREAEIKEEEEKKAEEAKKKAGTGSSLLL